VRKAGITIVLGAVMREAAVDGRRIRHLDCATRYGDVRISATGFVDASGDAALAWLAGLPCREPADGKIYGSQMIVLERVEEANYPTRDEISARLLEKGRSYGIGRRDGFAFPFPAAAPRSST
jgi:hypothetical protein